MGARSVLIVVNQYHIVTVIIRLAAACILMIALARGSNNVGYALAGFRCGRGESCPLAFLKLFGGLKMSLEVKKEYRNSIKFVCRKCGRVATVRKGTRCHRSGKCSRCLV